MRDATETLVKKILPKNWPWREGATAKRVAWMVHVLFLVVGTGFAVWSVYAVVVGLGAPEPEVSAQGNEVKRAPLPYWLRALQALAPLIAPFASYGIYYYLPEPDEE
jgi:hypothetical protein